LDFWRAAISEEQTRAEADFINNQLCLPVGAKVLDVPCGNGRLSIELGAFGFEMTGVDLALEFLEEAKRNADARGVSIDWRHSEMRALPWTNEFDGAFCFGNSFGYLDDDENVDFLSVVSQTLRPGARFILDAPAIAECLLPHFLEKRTIALGDVTATIESHYDHEQSRIFPNFTFVRNGVEDKRSSSQRIYTYKELAELLTASGLEPVAAYGSLTEESFKLGAHRLFLVCQKQ
jgi:SAM-dependent methyltransferase